MDPNSNPAQPTQPVNPTQPVTPNPVSPNPAPVNPMPANPAPVSPASGGPAPVNPTPPSPAPVPTPPLPPMTPPPAQPPQMPQLQPPRSKRPILFIALALILAAAAAGAIWWFMQPKSDSKSDADATKKAAAKSTGDSKAAPLTSAQKFTLGTPTDLGGMKPFDMGVPEVKDFRSGTPENACELQYGIFSATQVPGSDLSDIVARQLASVRSAGGTVNGPTPATALVLKDTTGRKSYSLPTLSFTIDANGSRAISHYSAGVLADGRRVAVTRVCAAKNTLPAPTETTLKPVNDVAARIAVQSQ